MSTTVGDFKTTFLVKKASFVSNGKNGNFSFAPEIRVGFNRISDKEWETVINVRVVDKEEQPFPFNLDVIVSLFTFFPKELPDGFSLENYLKVSSINILYPYVRSVVTNLTSTAMVQPLYLPLIDPVKFAENIQIPELNQ